MSRFVLVIVAVVSCTACATSTRPKANLAIDPEPTPAVASDQGSASETTDEPEYEEAIDLGFDGRSGPVQIEAAMSPEGEETALASQRQTTGKKKRASGDRKDEDDAEEAGEAEEGEGEE